MTAFLAHNVGFDYRMVQSAFKRHKMSYKRPTLCTVKLARALMPSSEKYNLDHLCKSLNIDNTSRHRAMGDCKATAELLHLLIESHGIDAVMDHVEGAWRLICLALILRPVSEDTLLKVGYSLANLFFSIHDKGAI